MVKHWITGLLLPIGVLMIAPSPATEPSGVRLVVTPTGNEVRYRVTEQLAGFDLPNDAVGKSQEVHGSVELDSTGRVIPATSGITATVSTLTSDRNRRDGYVRSRILETDSFPTVRLKPTSVAGLPWPLPVSGSSQFTLTGDLTIKGVTRPSTWQVTADFQGDTVTGTAFTAFTFPEFGLSRPRIPIVLSVGDTIRLEYDFRLAR